MSLNKSKALRTAEKYVLQGKIPSAIDEYKKVVDADPSDLTTINTLGDLYVRAGRIPDAIQNFSRIAESYRESGFTLKAIAMLKKISKLDPTNIDTSMKLANLYSQQGLLVEARQQYLQVADAYARSGQTRKALEAYQKIADLDPSNTSVRMKLADIYSREKMSDQAQEAFIMAGAEFMRKGDIEQALNANLKALTIDPENRQALTAIATIYTQQGQPDRAINILCDAFERNPGDVELLTILGRTYLSAGMMDDAERTFLSLVQLDRNRYHYLLEVGRRFLQMGDLDRASEQIDGCLEVLISKREEDKAIDFLRRILDRDMNHVGSLKRLAQIFTRIREDHNLIATLNSLAESAMKKGEDQEAIDALKELVHLEPDEPMHRQRLYNLGINDIAEGDSGAEVVRATGPLDYESAAFDDAFVIRQISEAEILAGHGQIDHAVYMLTEILKHTPDNVQVHTKLKDIFLRAGMNDKAASECIELARIYETRGESSRASDLLTEARQINPLSEQPQPRKAAEQVQSRKVSEPPQPKRKPEPPPRQDGGFAVPFVEEPSTVHAGFEVREATGGLDLTRYQTGPLVDHMGFVTFSETSAPVAMPPAEKAPKTSSADLVFSTAGDLPSDTMTKVLRDELEGVDFYIAQGYIEIARDTLDRLRSEHGDHAEIVARYRKLGGASDELSPVPSFTTEPAQPFVSSAQGDPALSDPFSSFAGLGQETFRAPATGELAPPLEKKADPGLESDLFLAVTNTTPEPEPEEPPPFFVTKESGPLVADMLVNFNTGELSGNSALDLLKASGALSSTEPPAKQPVNLAPPQAPSSRSVSNALQEPPEVKRETRPITPRAPESRPPAAAEPEPERRKRVSKPPMEERVGTAELIESLVSSLESTFETIQGLTESPSEEKHEPQPAAFTPQQASTAPTAFVDDSALAEQVTPESTDSELQAMLEELKGNTGELRLYKDYETHYSLGLAYKDMDLFDDAIEQFQMAYRLASIEEEESKSIQCCNMLGVCFKSKNLPKLAIMWFQRGLTVSNRPEDEYQALRYDIGLCYEEMGDPNKAIETFMEVYGIDVNYRQVAEKLRELQETKGA
ncbi:MAG TPA: tetratricopeptide repeat protein [Blastocatellia bacterium]|nr:tetratricopeptide repeat protein [Blastocatellia bacterium]